MIDSLIQKVIVLGLCILGLSFAAPAAWGQQSNKEPIQLTGATLQALLSKSFVFAGTNDGNGCVFIVVGEANRRTQFYRCPDGRSNTVQGTQRVEGNMACSTWPYREERCNEWFQVGENKYEIRNKGVRTHTVYILQ